MTINARNKGASGERELIRHLQSVADKVLGPGTVKLERNLEQVRYGGADMVGIAWLSGEVKRCEVLQLDKWWAKLCDLTRDDQVPVIFYRRNQEAWSVRCVVKVELSDGRRVRMVGSVSLADWLVWFAEELKQSGRGLVREVSIPPEKGDKRAPSA